MNPSTFDKKDLPPEYRDLNFTLTVKVHLDTMGHVVGRPIVVRSSGYTVVDEITVEKLMHEVTFMPVTLKENGRPVEVILDLPIFWE